jgi:diguanylate cyclase (GGDEF)-like protein/PAS domain S-box-containing protein
MDIVISSPSKINITIFALVASVVYYLLATLGISLSSPPEYIATFWPSNAAILAILLLLERRHWWMFILAMAPAITIANFQAGYSINRIIIFYIANCTEVLIAAYALRHFLGNHIRFNQLREMIIFILWAILIAPIISAFIASSTTFFDPVVNYWLIWRVWFLADAFGLLVLTPIIILTITSNFAWLKKISFAKMSEGLILILCIIIVSFLSFGTESETTSTYPFLLYTPIPVFLWAALRFGLHAVCSALLTITYFAIWNTVNSRGPFIVGTAADNALSLQLFLIAIAVPMMLISSLFSEHKRAARLITESKERISLLLDSTAEAIYGLDFDGNCTFCNTTCLRTLGYEKQDDLLGKNMHELIHHSRVDGSPYPAEDCQIYKAFKKNEKSHVDTEVLFRMDGSSFPVEYWSSPIIHNGITVGCVVTYLDITERKQAMASLQESNERFRTSFTDASIGMALVSLDYNIIKANQPFCEMLGYSEDELVGVLLKDITHEDDVEQSIQKHRMLVTGEISKYHIEKRYVHKQGHEIWSLLSMSLVRDNKTSPLYAIAQIQDISERKKVDEQLSYQASHDTLTGLVNRREFERRTERLLATIRQDNSEHALCFMDLDQFKVVNDTCGHVAGDGMLHQLSTVLKQTVRHRDTLARLGGDEFGVLMEHCSLDDAHRVATSLQKVIQDYHFSWEGRSFRVGVSIGLVPITETTSNLTELLKNADAACYMAKDSGRNRIQVYYADNAELSQRHGEMQWVTRLNQALEDGRLCLYAQAIVPINGGNEQHYELLIRMIDEKGKLIPPGAFLPAAERYNLISKLDHWVIEKAFTLLADHPDFLNQINFISINLSGQSLTEPMILEFIMEQLKDLGIQSNKICFEITETAAISNLSTATKFISMLKRLGCQFALDDFGSGLSSFAYLKHLPVDYLKIDGMFVKDIVDDPIDYAMVKSINEIGQVMGMQTIAEFVENDVIRGMLKEIGVNFAQGYGVGKPQAFHKLLQYQTTSLK